MIGLEDGRLEGNRTGHQIIPPRKLAIICAYLLVLRSNSRSQQGAVSEANQN